MPTEVGTPAGALGKVGFTFNLGQDPLFLPPLWHPTSFR
jgi:hypothetical protein